MTLYSVLALCARARLHPDVPPVLCRVATGVGNWTTLVEEAERHGIAPLVHSHLREADAPVPANARRALAALAARHKTAVNTRLRVLAEVLALYASERIETLVLKGAALASLVYPHPGLRPMRDIDLLVRARDAGRAWSLLARAGFDLPRDSGDGVPHGHHHLASVARNADGIAVSIEVHTALPLNEPRCPLRRFDDFASGAQAFEVNGVPARALPGFEMLWHVYRHAFCMPLGYEGLRLISVADMVSLVEAQPAAADLSAVRRAYPMLWRALPHLHALTPWSPAARTTLSFDPAREQTDPEALFARYPRFVPDPPLSRSLPRIARSILAPPLWWLRVRYGADSSLRGALGAWFAHQRTAWAQAARFAPGLLQRTSRAAR